MLQVFTFHFIFLILSALFRPSENRAPILLDDTTVNWPSDYSSIFEGAHPKFLRFGRASPSLYDIFGLEAHLRPPRGDEKDKFVGHYER
ncbi:hypothetical protein niasHT_025774 [Heterodera trifolii]|uniref:Effector protein n=1 Tax=Heterodera trifolii TaxID=157864 RepID=A0ABD2KR30_9BILA